MSHKLPFKGRADAGGEPAVHELSFLLAPTATVCGIMVSVYLFLLQRRKELSYHVLWSQPLIELKGKMRNRIKLEFDGLPAGDSNFLVVRIANTGHVSIHPGDYQVKLALDTGHGSRILMAEVVETVPEGLNDYTSAGSIIERIEGSALVLRPMLLNRHDSVTIQMLIDDYSGKVSLSGHVQGIKLLGERTERAKAPMLMIHGGQAVSWSSMFLLNPNQFFPLQFVEVIPFVFFFLTGQVMFFGGLHLSRQLSVGEQWAP